MSFLIHLITTIERGGAEKQLLILAKEQVKMGLSVSVIPLKGKTELLSDFEQIGVNVDLSLLDKPFLIQLVLLLRKFNLEKLTLHAHLPRAELIASLTSLRNPFFTSRHNAEQFFPRANRLISRFMSRFVILRARKVIAISFAVREFILNSKEAKDADKIVVVHYGIDIQKTTECADRSAVGRTTSPNPEFKIGTIARIDKQKDFPTLLMAFQMISKRFPDTRLYIVGDGPLVHEMQQLSRDLQIDHLITWRGRISEIDNYLRTLDLFILTSVYEGFGLVLLEAMKNSVPIIASQNSAIPEVLGDNYELLAETGSAADFYNKVENFRINNMKERVISYQGNRLELFSALKMASAISLVYQDA
jgi:glycosyltransferase involved in cell wall biosynthesis